MIWVVVGDLIPALIKAVVDVHVQTDAVVAINLRHVAVEGASVLEGVLDGDEILVGVREPGKRRRMDKVKTELKAKRNV